MVNLKKLMAMLIVILPLSSFAQQVVVAKDVIESTLRNTSYRLGVNSILNDRFNEINKQREKVLQYSIAIEEVQRATYNSLVNVNSALLQSRTLYRTTEKIPMILSNMGKIISQAAGNPMLLPLARKTQENLVLRIAGLQDFLNNVVLSSKQDNMMDPVVRNRLVQTIYTEINLIYGLTNAILNKFKLYTIQKSVNEVIPLFTWINKDRIIINDILRKLKL